MLLTLLITLVILFSTSVVVASDVNVTDSYTTSLVEDTQDVSVPLERTTDSSESSVFIESNVDNDSSKVSLSSEEVLESENSNTLSTNMNSNVLKDSKSTSLISMNNTIYYKGSFSITLVDSSNTTLANKTVNFIIDGVNYTSTTDSNGVASVALSLNPGKYTAIAYFAGDDDYSASGNVSSTINILATIQSKSITKYYKGATQYTATFYTSQGTLLTNTNVQITVNGKTYTKKTNSKGVASLTINLKPGSYKVTSKDPKTGYTLTTTFKVLSTISASSISKVYTDGKKFTATFYKSNGKVLANKNIKFKINGRTYTKKTDSKGVASLSLKSLKKGTYKIISYNTDGLTKTNTVKVYNKVSSKLSTNHYTFLTSDSKTIKVKLLNGLGYAPPKGQTVKITVNGKTYSKKTSSSGLASLKLPSLKEGIYTVKCKFDGNRYYKASSVSNYVSIISSKASKFALKSTTTFNKNSGAYFKVALSSGAVPLIKRDITFKLNGNTYTKTTNTNGIASLPINMDIGNYTVSYSVAKTSKINAASGSTKIIVKEKTSDVHAYWLLGADMNNVNLNSLATNGTTDILLNFKAYELYGKSGLESWIETANKAGINVHLWTQILYHNNTWINPVVNGKENTAFFTEKINEIKTYAAIKGLSGIHLDYLRYPGDANNTVGGTDAISSLVKQLVSAINSVNPSLVISASIMPETTQTAHYYGQNYSVFSQYVDVVVPMIYKGNYGKTSSWITTVAKWYKDNSKGAKVWAGIQTFGSDNNITRLSVTDLSNDINSALNGKSDGVVLYRYGIANSVNFNKLSVSQSNSSTDLTGKTVSVANILTGATNLKNYYENNKRLPTTVTTGGYTFSLPEFLYLMSQAIYQLGNSNTKAISIIGSVSAPSSPFGDTISSRDLTKDNYLIVARNVANFIVNNKIAPNYASSTLGKIIYSELVDSFSRILAFYKTNNVLPNYVTISYSSGCSTSSVSGTGLNEANTIKDLTAYLKSSKNCEVNNTKIKSLVNSLTKGLTSDTAKATAIFNYVRDTLAYSFYYNTKYGAVGALNAKKGNCVDHSHLLVAMFRTAGLATRYVQGTCTFTSGSIYGHVWTQVLINGKWVVADATSSKNSLGEVSNWNTKSFTLKGMYASLSF